MPTYYKKCLKTQKTQIKMVDLLSLRVVTHYTTQHFCIYDIFRKLTSSDPSEAYIWTPVL